MGNKDKRHREPKKAKKDSKKPAVESIVHQPVTVEVIRKKRERDEEE